MSKINANSPDLPEGFAESVGIIKERIRRAQYAALRAVNRELLSLYWDIGKIIAGRQVGESWGQAVIERLA